jgi:hypothetical protein
VFWAVPNEQLSLYPDHGFSHAPNPTRSLGDTDDGMSCLLMSCYILRDKLQNTKAGESDADKSEDFQIRIENAER